MFVNIGFDLADSYPGGRGYIVLKGGGPQESVDLIEKGHAVVKGGRGGGGVYMKQLFKKRFGVSPERWRKNKTST